MTSDTREFLLDGTMDAVITQSAEDTVIKCASLLRDLREGRRGDGFTDPMRIEVIFRENLP